MSLAGFLGTSVFYFLTSKNIPFLSAIALDVSIVVLIHQTYLLFTKHVFIRGGKTRETANTSIDS